MDGQIVVKLKKEIEITFPKWQFWNKSRTEIETFKQGFYFGMFVFESIAKNHNKKDMDFAKLEDTDLVHYLLFYAAKFYNFQNNLPFDFTINDAQIWREEMPQKTLNDIMQCMIDSKIGGESIGDLFLKSEDKKKASAVKK